MKNNNLYLLFFLLLSLIMIACKGDKSENREKIPQINDFLKFPRNMPVYILSKGHKGIEDIDISDKYKIVLYVDSFECTTCYLKLYLWNELIKQANNDLKDKIDFYFFIQPSKSSQVLYYLIKRDNFNYPIYLDNKNEFAKINDFPKELRTICFLLDNENKIKGLGDPTVDLIIWDKYKQVVNNNY